MSSRASIAASTGASLPLFGEADAPPSMSDLELARVMRGVHETVVIDDLALRMARGVEREVLARVARLRGVKRPRPARSLPEEVVRFIEWTESRLDEEQRWRVMGVGRRGGQTGKVAGILAVKHAQGYGVMVRFPDGKAECFRPEELAPVVGERTSCDEEGEDE